MDEELPAEQDVIDLATPERKSSRKSKKKKHHSASPSKSRGLFDRAQGLLSGAKTFLGEHVRLESPRQACLECRSNFTCSLKRVALCFWILIIFLSLLNLLGWLPPLPSLPHDEVEAVAEAPVDEPEASEVIVQKLPAAKSQKVNLALERDFGCRELECIAQCNGKAKPKCLKSRSCVIERDKICQKRCRKARCEDRCKDEPHLGYVEREQGLEKCKDGCTGPTATHNKCVVKCHIKYKPCKTKCFEMASKYKCDNPKVLAATSKLVDPAHAKKDDEASSSLKKDKGEDEEDDAGAGEAEDDVDADSDKKAPALVEDDLL